MLILLVGTTGSGKTTIGRKLASDLGWRFIEADDYHPLSNIEKVRSGHPLTDEDREAWLNALRHALDDVIANGENAVAVASALTGEQRRRLRAGEGATLVYLRGDEALIRQRVRRRRQHFAGEAILDDQFERLEEPEHPTFTVDVHKTPDEIVEQIRRALNV